MWTQISRMVEWAAAYVTSVSLFLIIIGCFSRSTFTLISKRLLWYTPFVCRIIYWVFINGLDFHWNEENKVRHWLKRKTHISKELTDFSAMSPLFVLLSFCLGSLSSVISSLDECIGISFSIMTIGSIFTIAFPSSPLSSLRSGWGLS